jgi:hypothetical protein
LPKYREVLTVSKFTIKGGIDFDNKKFKKGLSNAGRDADKFSKKMKGLGKMMAGAFAIGAITRGIRKVNDMGEDVGNQAAKVGITTDAFQALSHEITTAGGSSEALTTAMNTLAIRQSEAKNGTKTAIDAFKRLGISMEEVANDSLETLLEKISKGKVETRDFDSVADLLGSRTLKDLNTTMNLLADDGLAKIIKQAKEAGRVLDEDFIRNATAANRAISDLSIQAAVFFSKPIGGMARIFGALNTMFQGGNLFQAWSDSDPDNQAHKDMIKAREALAASKEATAATAARAEKAAAKAAVTSDLAARGEAGAKALADARDAAASVKYNDLRRIGGGMFKGGEARAERLQETIAKLNDEQVDLLVEIKANTADQQNPTGTF